MGYLFNSSTRISYLELDRGFCRRSSLNSALDINFYYCMSRDLKSPETYLTFVYKRVSEVR